MIMCPGPHTAGLGSGVGAGVASSSESVVSAPSSAAAASRALSTVSITRTARYERFTTSGTGWNDNVLPGEVKPAAARSSASWSEMADSSCLPASFLGRAAA